MKKKITKPKPSNKIKKPVKDKNLPVTKRLLDLKIQEVKSDVASVRLEMKAGFSKVDAQFNGVKAEVAGVKADVAGVKAQIKTMQTQMTKMMVILEEQNDRNRAALDGYATVYEKFNDTNERLNKLEVKTFGNRQR